MRVVFSFLISMANLSLLAQESRSIDEWIKVLGYGVGNQTKKTELTHDEVQARTGQCFPEQFASSMLLLSNNESFDAVNVKYDYKEQILLVNHGGKVHVAAPNMIKEIRFTDKGTDYKLINVSEMGRTYGRTGFYEVLLEKDENKLVCYRDIETIRPSYNAAMDTGTKDTVYLERKEFLIFGNQKSYKLENFKSKTLAQFDEHSNNLKSYIKREKLKFRNEEHLKKFAQYFWSL